MQNKRILHMYIIQYICLLIYLLLLFFFFLLQTNLHIDLKYGEWSLLPKQNTYKGTVSNDDK